jgi:hypothetical protein
MLLPAKSIMIVYGVVNGGQESLPTLLLKFWPILIIRRNYIPEESHNTERDLTIKTDWYNICQNFVKFVPGAAETYSTSLL